MMHLVASFDNQKIIEVECRKNLILVIVLDIDRVIRLALLNSTFRMSSLKKIHNRGDFAIPSVTAAV